MAAAQKCMHAFPSAHPFVLGRIRSPVAEPCGARPQRSDNDDSAERSWRPRRSRDESCAYPRGAAGARRVVTVRHSLCRPVVMMTLSFSSQTRAAGQLWRLLAQRLGD